MLALTPGGELQERVARRFASQGYITMKTMIGAV